MFERSGSLHPELGFRDGTSGPHAARTMMLSDLELLLDALPPDASREDFQQAIIEKNLLGKPTRKARELAARHMVTLYALDLENPIFRALRRLWPTASKDGRGLLALAVAVARDPLFRRTTEFFCQLGVGTALPRQTVEDLLAQQNPDRFSAASLKSFAQNVAGSWTAAGFLEGRLKKVRVHPEATPEAAAMLLFLGFLTGHTGQRLLSCCWTRILDVAEDVKESLIVSAANRGHLVFLNAGGVKEVRFPDYLTPEEEAVRSEASYAL